MAFEFNGELINRALDMAQGMTENAYVGANGQAVSEKIGEYNPSVFRMLSYDLMCVAPREQWGLLNNLTRRIQTLNETVNRMSKEPDPTKKMLYLKDTDRKECVMIQRKLERLLNEAPSLEVKASLIMLKNRIEQMTSYIVYVGVDSSIYAFKLFVDKVKNSSNDAIELRRMLQASMLLEQQREYARALLCVGSFPEMEDQLIMLISFYQMFICNVLIGNVDEAFEKLSILAAKLTASSALIVLFVQTSKVNLS